jgi:hypothetical protein
MTASIAWLAMGCHFDADGVEGAAGTVDADVTSADARVDAAPAPRPDAAPAGPPFCDRLDGTLVACYRFEDPDAPLHDGSSYANDGSDVHDLLLVNGPPGRGQAIAFAAQSVAAISDDPSLDLRNAATLELWLRADSLPAVGGRYGILDNNGQYGLFLGPDGKVRCAMSSTVPIALAVVPGVWTHIACTYDGQAMRLYQDGVLGNTTPTTVTLTDGSTDGMRLGANSPSGDVLAGALDDVRIYSVARTPAEICAAAGRTRCAP